MSSILTNNGAMVALQTLKSINSDLAKTQSEISTGKAVGSAKDNSALWAISKVMESDVNGFKAISESLSLGQSTVAVGRQASETVAELLTEVKGRIVAAQEENVDRDKIQADISALTSQISSVVGAAQFNGLNLLQGTEAVDILSSLDRGSDGSVEAQNITVNRQDLSSNAGVFGAGADLSANVSVDGGATDIADTANTANVVYATNAADGDQFNLQVGDTTVSYTAATGSLTPADISSGIAAAINAAGIEGITADGTTTGGTVVLSSTVSFEDVAINSTDTSTTTTVTSPASLEARAETISFDPGVAVSEGDGYRVTIAGSNYDYVAGRGETMEDVANGLKATIDAAALTGISTNVSINETTGAAELNVDNSNGTATLAVSGRAGGEATGGLFALNGIDVSTDAGADAALQNIETLIQTAIDGAAQFGSDESRLEIQSEFVGKLTDSLKSGIGSLVDADLEETSARLQALQVQQQLGVQALSIANQAPQSILSLFR